MSEWQPIETAPRDGTHILGWREGYKWPEIIFWEEHPEDIKGEAGEDGYWRYSDDLLADLINIDLDLISHWMPLPTPPEQER